MPRCAALAVPLTTACATVCAAHRGWHERSGGDKHNKATEAVCAPRRAVAGSLAGSLFAADLVMTA